MTFIPKILVLSIGSRVGQSVFSSLLKMSFSPQFIAANSTPDHPYLQQCQRTYLIPPVDSTKHYAQELEAIIEKERPDLIIPTIQAELVILSKLKTRLTQDYGCRFLLASSESLALSTDKYRCGQALKDFGFVSTARLPHEYESLLKEWGYPLIAKPRHGSGSDHVQVIFNHEDLKRTFSHVPDCIIQPFLIPVNWRVTRSKCKVSDVYHNGKLRQQDEFSVQILVAPEGEILGAFTLKCKYHHGHPVKLEPVSMPGLEEQAKNIAKHLVRSGFSGPLNLQAREFLQGRFAFYDVNPRFTVATAARTCLGFAEVESMVLSFLNLAETFPLQPNYNAFVLRHYTDELVNYRELEGANQSSQRAF